MTTANIRPGWSIDDLYAASMGLQESQQLLLDVGSGRQQPHALPEAWPITEADREATYLATLHHNHVDDSDATTVVAAGVGEAKEEAEGAAATATTMIDVSDSSGIKEAAASSAITQEEEQEKQSGPPSGGSSSLAQTGSSQRKRRRGPHHVCDGKLIADLLREEIAREEHAIRHDRSKHEDFKAKLKFQRECYDYGMTGVQILCASGNMSEEANTLLADVVSRTVMGLRRCTATVKSKGAAGGTVPTYDGEDEGGFNNQHAAADGGKEEADERRTTKGSGEEQEQQKAQE